MTWTLCLQEIIMKNSMGLKNLRNTMMSGNWLRLFESKGMPKLVRGKTLDSLIRMRKTTSKHWTLFHNQLTNITVKASVLPEELLRAQQPQSLIQKLPLTHSSRTVIGPQTTCFNLFRIQFWRVIRRLTKKGLMMETVQLYHTFHLWQR